MASIKGITLQISGDSKELVNSLNSADSALKNTKSALAAVDKALKLDPTNIEMLTEKEALLTNAIEETKDRLDVLKSAAELAADGLESGATTREQYAQLAAEIATTENKLSTLENTAEETRTALDSAADSAGDIAPELQESANAAEDLADSAEEADNELDDITSGGGWTEFASKIYSVKTVLEEVGEIAKEVASAIYDFVSGAIEAYADVEQYEGGLEKLFGDDAVTVIENANNALFTANLSASEYMENAIGISASLISSFEQAEESADNLSEEIIESDGDLSLFGDRLIDINSSLDRMSSFSNESLGTELNATALAADAVDVALRAAADNSATFGTDLEEVLNVFSSLARGTYSTLENLSLGFKGSQEGMIELINYSEIFEEEITSLDNVSFADMVFAIDEVQKKMGFAGTSASESLSTISGSIDSVENAWANLYAGLADPNEDISTLVENMMTAIQAAFTNLDPALDQFIESFGEVVPMLASYTDEFLALALDLVASLIEGLIQALPDLANPAADIVLDLVEFIIQNADLLISGALDLVVALAEGLAVHAPELVPECVALVGDVVTAITDHSNELYIAAGELIIGLALGLVNGIPQAVESIAEVLTSIEVEADSIIDDIKEAASTWGADMIDNFISGITSRISAFTDAVSNVASLVEEYIGFSCPDIGPLRNFDKSGGDMIDLFSEGMEDELGTLETSLDLTASTINDGMTQEPNFSGMFASLQDTILSSSNRPVEVNVQIGDEVLERFIVNGSHNYNYVSGGY